MFRVKTTFEDELQALVIQKQMAETMMKSRILNIRADRVVQERENREKVRCVNELLEEIERICNKGVANVRLFIAYIH